jgi:hypothetical protein
MSQGNLANTVVSQEFWPACRNCRFWAACAVRPRHPAYPHTWHWGHEVATFTDGKLILRSWVGTAAIGQPHTGCQDYEVHPQYVRAPRAHHQHYLALEAERDRLEAIFERLERQDRWTKRDEQRFVDALQRYRQVLAEQAALRAASGGTRAVAVTVPA